MTTVSRQLGQAHRAGYHVLPRFDVGQPALDTEDRPLDDHLHDLEGRMKGGRALQDLRRGLRA